MQLVHIIQLCYGIPGVIGYLVVAHAMYGVRRVLNRSFIVIFIVTAIIVSGFFFNFLARKLIFEVQKKKKPRNDYKHFPVSFQLFRVVTCELINFNYSIFSSSEYRNMVECVVESEVAEREDILILLQMALRASDYWVITLHLKILCDEFCIFSGAFKVC